METAHQNFVSKTSYNAKRLLDMYGDLAQLNVLWAGSPNYDGLIDQASIDSVPSLAGAGLTASQLADAEFIMATIKGNIENALPALTVLANLP
jgi:hypothetical protein